MKLPSRLFISISLASIGVVFIVLGLLPRSGENDLSRIQEIISRHIDTEVHTPQSLPKLIVFGADYCPHCRRMTPILRELKEQYISQLHVDYVNVKNKPDMGKQYRIHALPTLIFLDASSRKLFRHEGFMSKEQILVKWKELGFNLLYGDISYQ